MRRAFDIDGVMKTAPVATCVRAQCSQTCVSAPLLGSVSGRRRRVVSSWSAAWTLSRRRAPMSHHWYRRAVNAKSDIDGSIPRLKFYIKQIQKTEICEYRRKRPEAHTKNTRVLQRAQAPHKNLRSSSPAERRCVSCVINSFGASVFLGFSRKEGSTDVNFLENYATPYTSSRLALYSRWR